MHIAFPQETFNKLVTYLGTKPFAEVEDLMNELRTKFQAVEVNFPPKEGVDEIVQSTQTQSKQETQPGQEGGIQSVQEEPQAAS